MISPSVTIMHFMSGNTTIKANGVGTFWRGVDGGNSGILSLVIRVEVRDGVEGTIPFKLFTIPHDVSLEKTVGTFRGLHIAGCKCYVLV